MRSAASARLVDVATSVIGIDVKVGLADDVLGDVGAGIEGGGSGGSTSGTVGTGGTAGGAAGAIAVVADGVGDLQGVVVLLLVN